MDTDWHPLFALTISPLELFVRGSAVYWFLSQSFGSCSGAISAR